MDTKLEIDTNEPGEMYMLLKQSVQAVRRSLNSEGWADYRWWDYEGKPVHLERKTWAEMSDLNSVEDQLARHLKKQPQARLIFLLEDVGLSNMKGTVAYRLTPRATNKAPIFVPRHEVAQPIQKVYAWLYQAEKYCEIYCTSCMYESARAIVTFARADRKAEHTTFKRHIARLTWNPNQQVAMLMSIAHGLGETKAMALISKYGTLWNVLSADPSDLMTVEGIGWTLAYDTLRNVGRPDV